MPSLRFFSLSPPRHDIPSIATRRDKKICPLTNPSLLVRGDGANHALVDVQDFDRYVSPLLEKSTATTTELREALSQYEATVILRARPGVFASRKAGLDAHNYEAMTMASPLLTPRMRNIEFAETN